MAPRTAKLPLRGVESQTALRIPSGVRRRMTRRPGPQELLGHLHGDGLTEDPRAGSEAHQLLKLSHVSGDLVCEEVATSSATPSSSALRSRIATRVSKPGGFTSQINPQPRRDFTRSLDPGWSRDLVAREHDPLMGAVER